MKIAVYGKSINHSLKKNFEILFNNFSEKNIEFLIYKPFYDFFKNSMNLNLSVNSYFTSYSDLNNNIDLLISVGGDGTFLETITIIKNKDIPVLGINTGRLGFLATVSPNDISKLTNFIIEGNYTVEERTLLKLDTKGLFDDFSYALNDITIQKVGSGLITIHTYLDDEYLNSYWADGLIIATPTGSTAYSLSVGGPIMVPNIENFIISPIAPHTLSVRPIVVPDFVKITLKVESRDLEYILSLDHQSKRLNNSIDINISKGDYKIKLLKLPDTSYYQTLRNKLMWGIDKRN